MTKKKEPYYTRKLSKSKAIAAETKVSAPLENHYDPQPVPLLFDPHNFSNTVSVPFHHILDLQRRSPSNFCMYSTDPLLQPQYHPIDRTIPPDVLFLYCCIVVGPETQPNWNATAIHPISLFSPQVTYHVSNRCKTFGNNNYTVCNKTKNFSYLQLLIEKHSFRYGK